MVVPESGKLLVGKVGGGMQQQFVCYRYRATGKCQRQAHYNPMKMFTWTLVSWLQILLLFFHLWDKVSVSCLVIYILVPMNHHYTGFWLSVTAGISLTPFQPATRCYFYTKWVTSVAENKPIFLSGSLESGCIYHSAGFGFSITTSNERLKQPFIPCISF